MKRIFCVMLALLCIVTLFSCQNNTEPQKSSSSTTSNTSSSVTTSDSPSAKEAYIPDDREALPQLSKTFYLKAEAEAYSNYGDISITFGRLDGKGFDYGLSYRVYKKVGNTWELVPFRENYTIKYAAMVTESEGGFIVTLYKDLKDIPTAGTYLLAKEFDDGYAFAKFTIFEGNEPADVTPTRYEPENLHTLPKISEDFYMKATWVNKDNTILSLSFKRFDGESFEFNYGGYSVYKKSGNSWMMMSFKDGLAFESKIINAASGEIFVKPAEDLRDELTVGTYVVAKELSDGYAFAQMVISE